MILYLVQNCKFTPAALPGADSAAASSSSASVSATIRRPEPHAFDAVSALSATAGSRLTRRVAKLRRRQAARAEPSLKQLAPPSAADGASGSDAATVPAATAGVGLGQKRPRPATAEPAAGVGAQPARGLVQLSRITVAAEAVRAVSDLFVGNPILQSYDLVAVAPGDPEVLRHAVASGVADIIRLDMSGGRLPFPLKADLVHACLAAGCVFELEYAPAIRDPTCRRFFIANAAELLRLTRGNGILLTSGAANALELRSPADAAAIAGLAGLSARQCALAMTAAAAQAIRHAEKRLTGALAGAAGAVLPRGKPTGLTHGAAHAAAASLGGALLHVGVPVSLPRGLPEASAEREVEEVAEAADRGAAPAAGAGAAASASAAKKPRLAAGAARGASGGDNEGLGADDDGNLMLLGAGATGDAAEEEDEDDGGASAAIAALAGAGLNRDRRKPRQQGGPKKGSSQGKQDRRQRLMATSQRQLLAVESSLAREPAAAGAGSKGAGGDSAGGSKARPWLGSAGARGLVVAAAPASETTKGKANGMQWAVPR